MLIASKSQVGCVGFKCQKILAQHVDYWSHPAAIVLGAKRHQQAVEVFVTDEVVPCVKARSVKHYYKEIPSWDPEVMQTPWFSEVKFRSAEKSPPSPTKTWVKARHNKVTPMQLILTLRFVK